MSRARLMIAAFVVIAGSLAAQVSIGTDRLPVEISSGTQTNPGTAPAVVWAEQVSMPGIAGIQLEFDVAELTSDDDAIIVRNPLDGQVHELHRKQLAQWRNRSAWFNGSTLDVSLRLAAGSTANLTIGNAVVQVPTAPVGPDEICGADDRVASSDPRVCRLVFNALTFSYGCTGWMINDRSTVLGAGHCAATNPSYFSLAEFNVPQSTSGGVIVHSAVADQYPIDGSSLTFSNNGPGNDWAVARLHPNSQGVTAYQRQGAAFSLATTSTPSQSGTFRLTGYGLDNTPITATNTQQTSLGGNVALVGDQIRHTVDSEGGNSGGPLIDETTGLAVGVHTHGGCTAAGFNTATNILKPALQSAITLQSGCATVPLQNGSDAFVSCSSTIINTTQSSGNFVGVGVISQYYNPGEDWDMNVTGIVSQRGALQTDYCIANGHAGIVPAVSGQVYRFAGTGGAWAEFSIASPIAVGQWNVFGWGSDDFFQLYEFNVTAAGVYDVTVNTDPFVEWTLIGGAPQSTWQVGAALQSGSGASGTRQAAMSLGWHCLVVHRPVSPGLFGTSTVTINVRPTAVGMTLTPFVPATVTTDYERISVQATPSHWNAVAVTSATSHWNLGLGKGQATVGTNTSFVVGNYTVNTNTPPPLAGVVARSSGTGDAVVEHVSASAGTLEYVSYLTIAADHVIGVKEYQVNAPGNYSVSVLGDPGLSFAVFNAQNTNFWRADHDDQVQHHQVGTTGAIVSLDAGMNAVVVYRRQGTIPTAATVAVSVCTPTSTYALSPSTTTQIVAVSCAPFSVTPQSGHWEGVAVASNADWDIAAGSASSLLGSTSSDFLVANGHAGAFESQYGIVSRYAGTSFGFVHQAPLSTLTPGTPAVVTLGASQIMTLIEFQVTATRDHVISVSGNASGSCLWHLFDPGTSGAWRPRTSATASGLTDGTASAAVTLTPGWYLLTIVHETAAPTPGTFTVDVTPGASPTPSITTIAPTTAAVGSSALTMTVNGSGFFAGSEVRWNGTALPTTFVSTTLLTATVSASRLAAAGSNTVVVFNAAPGGGTSNAKTFSVTNPSPTLSSISPASKLAGSAAFTLTAVGTSFNSQSVIQWNGGSLTTTFVSATQLTASVPAALVATAGSPTVRVQNPAPGGGTSQSLTFTVNNPVPVLTATSPTSVNAGASGFTLTATGSGFVAASVIKVGVTSLPTTFVSATQLTAPVPASMIATTGVLNVTVVNAAPAGGTSAAIPVTVVGPQIVAISPASIAVQTPASVSTIVTVTGSGFVPASQIYADGVPLVMTSLTASQIVCVLPTLPQTQVPGGIAFAVENFGTVDSNAKALVVGDGHNQGTIGHWPLLDPLVPGNPFALVIDGGTPNAPLLLSIDTSMPAPITNWPNAAGGMVLSLGMPGAPGYTPVLDGIGLFGPAVPGVAFSAAQPGNTAPGGRFVLPGIVAPSPSPSLSFTMQAAYPDPASPVGFRLTFARWPSGI